MRFLYSIFACSLLVLFACSGPAEEEMSIEAPDDSAAPVEPQTIDLFNGEDLANWDAFLVEPDVTKEDIWSVQDGIMVCKGEPLGYIYTNRGFTSYKLEVEWRWAPGTEPGNSGVLMRIGGEPRGIPRSIEAQLMGGNAGDVYGFHGLTLTGPEDRFSSQEGHELLGDFVGVKKTQGNENPPGEWNRYEIELNGSDLTVSVNGLMVNEVRDCEVAEGPIGLQSEGGEIHFRTVRLTPLQ